MNEKAKKSHGWGRTWGGSKAEEKRAADAALANMRTEGKLTPEQRRQFQRSQGVRP